MDFHRHIHQCAHKQVIYTLHALDEMNAELELITTDDVRAIIFQGNIIEEYPQDKRGHFGKMGNGPEDEEKAMKCMLCGGNLEKSAASYTVDRKGYHLFIEKIPAYVCARCGEKAFDEKEVIAIQNMLKAFEDKLEQVQMVA